MEGAQALPALLWGAAHISEGAFIAWEPTNFNNIVRLLLLSQWNLQLQRNGIDRQSTLLRLLPALKLSLAGQEQRAETQGQTHGWK